MSVGLPILAVMFQSIVSNHKYEIVENHGCFPGSPRIWATFAAYGIWPLILSFIAFVHSVLTTLRCLGMKSSGLFTSQSEIDQHVSSRTLISSSISSVVLFPICAFNLIYTVSLGVLPWPGLESLKKNYHIPSITTVDSPLYPLRSRLLDIVAIEHIVASILFFLIFGTGRVAFSCYKGVFYNVRAKFRTTPHIGTPEELSGFLTSDDSESWESGQTAVEKQPPSLPLGR